MAISLFISFQKAIDNNKYLIIKEDCSLHKMYLYLILVLIFDSNILLTVNNKGRMSLYLIGRQSY